MGAHSPVADISDVARLVELVHRPVIEELAMRATPFIGCLYAGLMLTDDGPRVLEFNCRFGDPETQAVLMRLESDLVEALEASIEGRVSDGIFNWSSDAACCVVLASGGYPGSFVAGKKISGLEQAAQLKNVQVFHAGTSKRDDGIYTSGGRVLGVTARAPQLADAITKACEAVGMINFEGMQYRKDIGGRALKSFRS